MGLPFAQRAARRFVAGERLEDAIEVVRDLNRQGMVATLDELGEDVSTPAASRASLAEILQILDVIHETKAGSNVSLKLTQLGLRVREDLCRENLIQVLERATRYKQFVRVDMEGSDVTEQTFRIYEDLHELYPNVGVVVQSYLRRSEADVIERLIPRGASVRLCKGAYSEPPDIAFPKKSEVDANYRRLADLLLSRQARDRGVRTAIATHDQSLVRYVQDKVDRGEVDRKGFEFQMLHGIARPLQRMLVEQGYVVRIYVSYGTQWYPYFMRRLAERPANVFFLLKNIFRG